MTGDALRLNLGAGGGWSPIQEGAGAFAQGLPFEVLGSVQSTAVPEPSTFALLLLAVPLLAIRRRRAVG